jgi:S1-C subfamily serine protease
VAHYDPQIRHKTREEAKRIAWLGVEFTPLNRELAKQLEVEKQTKDGKIGLYVNRVYAGSPAGGMGIAPGDILLRIDTRKRPHPVELNMSEYGASSFRFDWTQYMDYQYMEEYGGTQPKWPPRLNYLTMLLQTIGEGEDVTLTYLHEGQEISEDFTIELAPRDFASAEKYKNKEIGITVKDVTYEVRAALRLPDEKPAVVVAKVEPGSPTEVAKIRPFELITAIDGAAVGSADQFEERIEAALEQDEPSVRLTVEYLGKSRLADLELTQAEAAESGEGGE